jgi:hypothetical protein
LSGAVAAPRPWGSCQHHHRLVDWRSHSSCGFRLWDNPVLMRSQPLCLYWWHHCVMYPCSDVHVNSSSYCLFEVFVLVRLILSYITVCVWLFIELFIYQLCILCFAVLCCDCNWNCNLRWVTKRICHWLCIYKYLYSVLRCALLWLELEPATGYQAHGKGKDVLNTYMNIHIVFLRSLSLSCSYCASL